jgi:transcription elongation factor
MSRDLELHEADVPIGIAPGANKAIKCDPNDPLSGLHVVAVQGEYKSYRGIIKDTNPVTGRARVELQAGQRVRTFKMTQLMDLE